MSADLLYALCLLLLPLSLLVFLLRGKWQRLAGWTWLTYGTVLMVLAVASGVLR
jgi:hypothetical protein